MQVKPREQELRQFVGARPVGAFHGRGAALDELRAWYRATPTGAGSILEVTGPTGAGKRELLRQFTVRAWAEDCFALHLAPRHEGGSWLARLIIVQCLAWHGAIRLMSGAEQAFDPAGLAAACHQARLSPLAGHAMRSEGAPETPRISELLATARRLVQQPMVLVFEANGVAEPLLSAVLRAASAAGVPVIVGLAEGDPACPVNACRRLELGPLEVPEAEALVRHTGHELGWRVSPDPVRPILKRLGPWPAMVLEWTRMVDARPAGTNPMRLAEEAYLRLLDQSDWARGMQRRFDALIPALDRERALHLVEMARLEPATLTAEQAAAVLGRSGPALERVLDSLERLGLLRRRAARWTAPHGEATLDWARLRYHESINPTGPEAARLDLLTGLLRAPRAEEDRLASGLSSREMIARTLAAFRNQTLPHVLFHYPDYFEGVGALDRVRRREVLLQATPTFNVPEIVGVARWSPPGEDPEAAIEYHYGVGYRNGRYVRSNEQTWIVADVSFTRSLTSLEVDRAQAGARQLARMLGTTTPVLWIVTGHEVTEEAQRVLEQRRIHCSCTEQLEALYERIVLGYASKPSGPIPVAPAADAPPAGERDAVRKGTAAYDEPAEAKAEPAGCETSVLTLPARENAETVAAVMAEKIAGRAELGATEAGRVKTAVLEGVLNAIEHSPNPEKSVQITFRIRPDRLEIVIENEGPRFDPLAIPEPDPDSKLSAVRKRGWGISLMKRFMDDVTFEPGPRGTRLILTKRRAGAAVRDVGGPHPQTDGQAPQAMHSRRSVGR